MRRGVGWLGLATAVVGLVTVAFSDVVLRIPGYFGNGIDPHSYDVVGSLLLGFGAAMIATEVWRTRPRKTPPDERLAWLAGAEWAAAMVDDPGLASQALAVFRHYDGNNGTNVRLCMNSECPYPTKEKR